MVIRVSSLTYNCHVIGHELFFVEFTLIYDLTILYNLRFDDLQFTIYLRFSNLAIYRAAANSSLFILNSSFTKGGSKLFTLHFAEGDRRGLGRGFSPLSIPNYPLTSHPLPLTPIINLRSHEYSADEGVDGYVCQDDER